MASVRYLSNRMSHGSIIIFTDWSILYPIDLSNPTLDVIHEKYLACLRSFAKKHFPNQPNRVEELLVRLPEVMMVFKIIDTR